MNRNHLKKQIDRLSINYGRPADPATYAFFLDELSALSEGNLKKSVDRIIAEDQYFPTVQRIREAAVLGKGTGTSRALLQGANPTVNGKPFLPTDWGKPEESIVLKSFRFARAFHSENCSGSSVLQMYDE